MTSTGPAVRRMGHDAVSVRCIRCDAELEATSRVEAGVPVCGRSSCAAFGARCGAVLSVLALLADWATVIEVTAAADTLTSTWTVGQSLRGLERAGLVDSRVPSPVPGGGGGRSPHVHRLTDAGRVLAATTPAPAPAPASRTPAPAEATESPSSPARPAVGYMSSARLSMPEQRRLARLLREWACERGLTLAALVTETGPGARDGFDRLRATVAHHESPTVVVPSYEHFAVGARRQSAIVSDLERAGVVIVAMDDLGGRGEPA